MRWDAWGLFERYTEGARNAVILAQEEARELRHSYVGSEHILLGLLREQEGLAARVLGSLDISVDDVRTRVICIVAAGEERASGQIPFTPRARRALELSLREALSLSHNYIGTEHVLLGLVRDDDGVAVRILRELGADSGTVGNAMIQLVSSRPAAAGAPGLRRSMDADPGVLPVDQAWLGGFGGFLPDLTAEIRQELQREPDTGDLLLALVCAPETLAGRVLQDLGVSRDELPTLIERARAAGLPSETDRIEEARQRKELAIESGQHDEAHRSREEERALTRASRDRRTASLNELRRHLGISVRADDR